MNYLYVLLAGLVMGLGGGWQIESLRAGHQLDQLRAEIQQHQVESLQRLVEANDKADQARAALEVSRRALAAITRKTTNEALAKTTGRECLSADVVSVLQPAAGDGLPARAPGPDPRPGRAASDSDVVEWRAAVVQQYAGCRDQLRAVRVHQGYEPGAARDEKPP